MEVIHRLRPYPDNRSDLTRISVSALPGICYLDFVINILIQIIHFIRHRIDQRSCTNDQLWNDHPAQKRQ